MKRMKILVPALLLICMLIASSSAYAIDNPIAGRVGILEANSQAFISKFSDKSLTLASPIYLSNLNNDLEAICYPLIPSGYVIISYKDSTVLEFSDEAPCPYSPNETNHYYNGPMQYYTGSPSALRHTLSGEIEVPTNRFAKSYASVAVLPQTRSMQTTDQIPYLPLTLQQNGYYCGPTAVAIMLDYYDRHVSGTYYPTGVTTAAGVREYLVNNYFLWNQGMSIPDLRDGYGTSFVGMQAYFNRAGITYKSVKVKSATYSVIAGRVAADRPCIVGIYTNLIAPGQSGTHHVVAYGVGYDSADPDDMYILCNNGWGSNGVWFNSGGLSNTPGLGVLYW